MKKINALLLKAQQLTSNDDAQILAFVDKQEGVLEVSINIVDAKDHQIHEDKSFNTKQELDAYIDSLALKHNIKGENALKIFKEYGLED